MIAKPADSLPGIMRRGKGDYQIMNLFGKAESFCTTFLGITDHSLTISASFTISFHLLVTVVSSIYTFNAATGRYSIKVGSYSIVW
jgi:hypothetical protein